MGLTLTKENFVSHSYPPITGQAALQALQRAERIDQYRTRVSKSTINREARAGQNYMPVLHSLKRSVPHTDPSSPWPNGQVIWMDPSADGGLPHTRPPYFICMPATFPAKNLRQTLLHERVHLSQRSYPKQWDKIFKEAWEMKPWCSSLPDSIQSRRRMNPDLMMTSLYIWKDKYVVLALYKSEIRPDLNEIDLVWWDAVNRTVFREPPPGWKEFFGTNSSGEHPYELSAYLIESPPDNSKAYDAIKSRLGSLPRGDVWLL
jgi:hypothetical protein